MQDPERITRFTRGFTVLRDPPWLPIALWIAVVPVLSQLGYIPPGWQLPTAVVAALATALGVFWFRRTYDVVNPEPDSLPLPSRRSVGVAIVLGALVLEIVSSLTSLPVRLGMFLFGGWLAWGARASGGFRPHLYVLAAICVAAGLLPAFVTVSDQFRVAIFQMAFGLGWAYVCIRDYSVLRRSLAHVHR